MTPLSLLEDQVDKLLLMCNDLFTEYKNVEYNHCFLLFIEKDGSCYPIHWLEVCLTKLPAKIAANFETVDVTEKHRQIFDILVKKISGIYPIFKDSKDNHPVDYLYNMYLKAL